MTDPKGIKIGDKLLVRYPYGEQPSPASHGANGKINNPSVYAGYKQTLAAGIGWLYDNDILEVTYASKDDFLVYCKRYDFTFNIDSAAIKYYTIPLKINTAQVWNDLND